MSTPAGVDAGDHVFPSDDVFSWQLFSDMSLELSCPIATQRPPPYATAMHVYLKSLLLVDAYHVAPESSDQRSVEQIVGIPV
jgi:hypothetical protein